MFVYISGDADGAGQLVGRARLADDEEALRKLSRSLDDGNELFQKWAESKGGSLVEAGGDEFCCEVDAQHLGDLPALKEQYEQLVQATLSIGVGMKISESSKALLAVKLTGKNAIRFYDDDCQEILDKATQKPESDKISEEYLAPIAKAFKQAVAHGTMGGQAVAMNHGAFGGHHKHRAIALLKQPEDQSEEQGIYNLLSSADAAKSAAPPEMTHAAADFEKQMHSAAQAGESQDQKDQVTHQAHHETIKTRIVDVLQVLKTQAPVLEQLKTKAPDTYMSIMGLTQIVIQLAQQLSPMAKSEDVGDQIKSVIDSVRQADTGSDNHCSNCCYKTEALHHLLGDGSLAIHQLNDESGPHWYLRSGDKVLDCLENEHNNLPYDRGVDTTHMFGNLPSEPAQKIIDKVLGLSMEKAALPMPKANPHKQLNLPVGSELDEKIKIQHDDGTTGWNQVASGMVQSQDSSGHPVSSRHPNAK